MGVYSPARWCKVTREDDQEPVVTWSSHPLSGKTSAGTVVTTGNVGDCRQDNLIS